MVILFAYRRVAQTLNLIFPETTNRKCLICSQSFSVISIFCLSKRFKNYFFGLTNLSSRTCCWLLAAVGKILNWKQVKENISVLFIALSLAMYLIGKEKLSYTCEEGEESKSMEY